jgi:phosphoribosylanthranilate isomerase
MTTSSVRQDGLLKTCGATTVDDVELLATAGADLVGLWHGVPNGPAELSIDRLAKLAEAARATGVLRPIMVTFLGDAEKMAEALAHTGIEWIQLHAYQSPPVIRDLRALVHNDVTIVKVLHVERGKCVERRLIPAYERAGTDVFLLDRVGDNGQVGSTGVQLHESSVVDLVPQLNRPFLLAGGIGADNRVDYPVLTAHPGYLGIDVDTAARDHSGRFDESSVAAIAVEWGTSRAREMVG